MKKKKKKELILGPLLKVDQNQIIFSMILNFLCFEDKSFYYNVA